MFDFPFYTLSGIQNVLHSVSRSWSIMGGGYGVRVKRGSEVRFLLAYLYKAYG